MPYVTNVDAMYAFIIIASIITILAYIILVSPRSKPQEITIDAVLDSFSKMWPRATELLKEDVQQKVTIPRLILVNHNLTILYRDERNTNQAETIDISRSAMLGAIIISFQGGKIMRWIQNGKEIGFENGRAAIDILKIVRIQADQFKGLSVAEA